MTEETLQSDQRLALLPVPSDCRMVHLPIEHIFISEDRAEVVRSLPLSWSAGRQCLFVDTITLFVHDDSLRVTIEGENSPKVGNSRIFRWYERQDEQQTSRERVFLETLQQLLQRLIELLDRDTLERSESETILKSLKAANESMIREVLYNQISPDNYRGKFTQLIDWLRTNLQNRHENRFALESILEEFQMLMREEREDTSVLNKRAGVLVMFEAVQAGQGLLKVRYEVPCAQWRPFHEAHLLDEGGDEERVLFITHAAVWQKTGETWADCRLTLSTARPSLGLDMPVPKDDILKLRVKTEEERKQVRVSIRDQAIRHTGETDDKGPGIPDDGGETQNYSPAGKTSIPDDGRPYMIELNRFEIKCSSSQIAAPELSDRVYLRSRVQGPPKPLLAGPVELYRQQGFIGRGFLDFVGQGEPFTLDWGSEDFIQLIRWVDSRKEEGGVISRPKEFMTVNVLVRNMGAENIHFTLQERFPVSELEQVTVEQDMLPENAVMDKDGIVSVPVTVGPGEEKKFVFKYHLVMDKNVSFQ